MIDQQVGIFTKETHGQSKEDAMAPPMELPPENKEEDSTPEKQISAVTVSAIGK